MTIKSTPDFWKLRKGKPETLRVGSIETVRTTWDKKNKKGTVRVIEVLSEDSVVLGSAQTKFKILDSGLHVASADVDSWLWDEPLVGEDINKANIRLKAGYGLGVTSAIRYEPTLPPQAKK